MKDKTTISLIVLPILALFLLQPELRGEPSRSTENLRQETVLLPPSAPEKESLIPVSLLAIGSTKETVGLFIIYDDPQTERVPDYVELYDAAGYLLLIRWIDEIGIHRTAVDKGLLKEDSPEPIGVLVLLNEGTPS